ncbi:hypothetical protein EVAR_17469_1 [Eumeta japonica]|uniref:Uncharacterized protein n=1 Tax=Eumeta variegata TaxID=151549 RepID=A0A4C1VAB2_EUMVA|nr:hypothetical protein EVAR_17469_1 [Eumeta japonica]
MPAKFVKLSVADFGHRIGDGSLTAPSPLPPNRTGSAWEPLGLKLKDESRKSKFDETLWDATLVPIGQAVQKLRGLNTHKNTHRHRLTRAHKHTYTHTHTQIRMRARTLHPGRHHRKIVRVASRDLKTSRSDKNSISEKRRDIAKGKEHFFPERTIGSSSLTGRAPTASRSGDPAYWNRG